MPKRVLSIGQCSMDQGPISRMLTSNFDVEVECADLPDDALQKLREGSFDLVLVNRKLDADYSDGMDIIRTLKADEKLSAVPAMLVSNYPEAQQAAIAAGAERGFGKAELASPEVVERLTTYLK